ncbi:glutamyl-tRNA synthetase, partial [Neisseria arctica]
KQARATTCYRTKKGGGAWGKKAKKEDTATCDRRWRPEAGKVLPPIPEGREPVVRFKTPIKGTTTWHDLVKCEISSTNEAVDDLIIAQADG